MTREDIDGQKRCRWVPLNKPLCVKYHDEEWGVPVTDDRKMFEFIVLESFQAGLSWEMILNKRENFRKAFSRFDPEKVAAYGEKMIDELVQDAGIVRNRKKILAAINNAQRFLEIADLSHSFCNYFWQFTDNKPIINRWKTDQNIPANTKLSDTISADMKKCGFKFFGTTVCYAHMQAVGMVNDHTVDCFRHGECEALA